MYANNTQLKDDDDKNKKGGMPTWVIILAVIIPVCFLCYKAIPKKSQLGQGREFGFNASSNVVLDEK